MFARATGIGFGNSAAVLVSYTIIEYTDATFSTAKATEKGIGTLTLGGSSGIANCTLARTTKQTSATSLNSQPATQNIAPATGISIGTAANTLVFIGASAADIPAYSPYFNVSGTGDAKGVSYPQAAAANSVVALGNAFDYLVLFDWKVPMLVKAAYILVAAAYTGGTTNAYGTIYEPEATNGVPGKRLLDLGVFGTSNASLNSTGFQKTAVHANGYFLTPGEYWFRIATFFNGGSGTPSLNNGGTPINSGRSGTFSGGLGALGVPPAIQGAHQGSSVSGAAPDPWSNGIDIGMSFGGGSTPGFTLSPS